MPEDGQRAPEHSSKPLDSHATHDSGTWPVSNGVPAPEVDDFGLPIRKLPKRSYTDAPEESDDEAPDPAIEGSPKQPDDHTLEQTRDNSDGQTEPMNTSQTPHPTNPSQSDAPARVDESRPDHAPLAPSPADAMPSDSGAEREQLFTSTSDTDRQLPSPAVTTTTKDVPVQDEARDAVLASQNDTARHSAAGPSEWSHQHVATEVVDAKKDNYDDDEWQEMPAYATHTVYDDWGKVLAREIAELDEEQVAYGQLGGAGKGYTKVQLDEDVQSATSLDEDTAYLFKAEAAPNTLTEEDEGRDILSQMQATKDLLTEGQRIAYVGLVRLSMITMIKDLEKLERTKGVKKFLDTATEAMQMWSQKMMVRLYSHMEIDAAEQIMIEQLAEHGVEPGDLTPTLMQNARVKNPVPQNQSTNQSTTSLPRTSMTKTDEPSSLNSNPASASATAPGTPALSADTTFPQDTSPPPYEENNPPDYLTLKDPAELANSKSIDLDLRWTVLCDLFLVLIADSVYDARSRTLLEHVGSALSIPWIDICRFEKRVTDALEMQEAADKENWNEDDHMEQRKKSARNRRLVMMGLATVGGGLVIGLSAGLLAPVIGAGLAAGFTTIGVAGTSGFLAGAGGAAVITSIGVTTGGTIAVRATGRRTGAVKTFEYRPLYNNKRVNLIVTVAGWMTGKVDDVRLPFSTVDPVMGDMYSIFWEPEMLRSMGDTINILATEALTQGLQQILGSTVLIALMSAMQLPLVLTKLSYLIDNPWAVSLARADMAGLILADSLIDRNLGVRPITLVGFSIGARVIFSCLKELANRGAFGLIQNVYLFGSPMVVKTDEYLRAKAVVSGRFVNGYANNDWILGYLFRATSGGIMKVAGLAPVDISGIENHDVTSLVPGHMAYRKAMPRLLREVGWVVESDEFDEIEDPDPENHENRQRELINEIEEARRNLEKKPEKKGFKALFSRNKKNAERKSWEVYEEQAKAESSANGAQAGSLPPQVMFDVDAIRAEVADLAAQGIEVKEIKSTLPPMKLNIDQQTLNASPGSPRLGSLRQTRSFSGLYDPAPSSPSDNHSSSNRWGPKPVPHQAKNDYDYNEHDHHDDSNNISMTFDAPGPSPMSSPKAIRDGSSSWNPSPAGSAGSARASPAPPAHAVVTEPRPLLHSSNTMPVTASHTNTTHATQEHNAWADEDELGHEKEVSMTFE